MTKKEIAKALSIAYKPYSLLSRHKKKIENVVSELAKMPANVYVYGMLSQLRASLHFLEIYEELKKKKSSEEVGKCQRS